MIDALKISEEAREIFSNMLSPEVFFWQHTTYNLLLATYFF